MIETREKIINGATYSVTQLPARRAIRLKAKLIKLFGPVLAQMFISSDSKNEDEQKNNIVKAIELLGAHIDENTFEQLVMEILTGVRKNGVELTPSVVDLEFSGDMGTLYQVLWFVVEVNYSNFFTMLGIGNQFTQQTAQQTDDSKKIFTRK